MSSSEMIHHENPSVMFLGEIGLFVRDRTPIKHVEIKVGTRPYNPLRSWGNGVEIMVRVRIGGKKFIFTVNTIIAP